MAITDDLTGAVLFASALAATGLRVSIDGSPSNGNSDLSILNTARATS